MIAAGWIVVIICLVADIFVIGFATRMILKFRREERAEKAKEVMARLTGEKEAKEVLDRMNHREQEHKIYNILTELVSEVDKEAKEDYRAQLIGKFTDAFSPFFQGLMEKIVPEAYPTPHAVRLLPHLHAPNNPFQGLANKKEEEDGDKQS